MRAERFQLAIAGEGRGVAVADFSWNGWPDLVLSCGNDGAMALVNRGNPGGHSFFVKLRDDRGNPDAVGARSPPPHLGDRRECRRLARGNPMNRGKSSP